MKNITIYGVEYMPVKMNEIAKDYQIISYNDGYGVIFEIQKYGFYKGTNGIIWESLTNMANTTYHSVKRLSDDEVFKVGDNFRNGNKGDVFKIVKIEIVKGVVQLWDDSCFTEMNNAVKVKFRVIVTTEDGVEITNGEQLLYGVDRHYNVMEHDVNVNAMLHSITYFATTTARDEYIFQNKPITTTYKEFKDRPSSPKEFFKSKQKL